VRVVISPFQPIVVRGFSTIHPHHDLHAVRKFLRRAFSFAALFSAISVVDRAGPDHHQQRVFLPQDADDPLGLRATVALMASLTGDTALMARATAAADDFFDV